jgi:hypothetical protein
MRTPIIRACLLVLPLMLSLQGCHVSGGSITGSTTCTDNGPNAGICTSTLGGTINFQPSSTLASAGTDDLATMADGSYTLSVSAPGAIYTPAPNATPTATITVTTDTGYTSSIGVVLSPVAPAIAAVNAGDAVYSYNLPSTPDFAAWIQQVSANTNSTMSISSSAGIPLQAAPGSGVVTMTTVLTSNAVGTYNVGNFTTRRFSSNKGNPPCQPGMVCTQ